METLSFIILILLTLVGFSAGSVFRAGKNVDLKPQIIDLVIIILLWSGVIYSRLTFDLNRWLMILIGVTIGFFIGFLSVLPRKLVKTEVPTENVMETASLNFFKKLWRIWEAFSRRMGSYQSRVMLSFFFFVIISPAAIILKIFSDPLKIKKKNLDTFWQTREKTQDDIERARRQF